jgi:membrane protein required for colicin V production
MANGVASMNGLDYAIVALIAVGALYGFSRGAMRMITSALSLIGGLYVASLYYAPVGNWAFRAFGVGQAAGQVVGYVAVFVAAFVAIEIAGNAAIRFLHLVHMGWIDRLVGGAVGGALSAFALGLLVMLLTLLLPANAELLGKSRLAPGLLAYNDAVLAYIPARVKQDYQAKRAQLFNLWQREAASALPAISRATSSPTP